MVVLSGWREQGAQVVDLKMRKVTQMLLQDGAFYGAARPTVIISVSPGATLTYYSSMRGETALPPSRTSSSWQRQKLRMARAQAIWREWRFRPTEDSFMSPRMSAIGLRW